MIRRVGRIVRRRAPRRSAATGERVGAAGPGPVHTGPVHTGAVRTGAMRLGAAVVAVVAVVAMGALLAGCGGGGSDTTETTAPRHGGTLRIGVSAVSSLDPASVAAEAGAATVYGLFTETLVRVEPGSGRARPGLAASWEVNAAQTTFTFRIRDGAKFSDGSRVTSTDVKATLDRVAAKATNSPLAHLLDVVAGYTASQSGAAPGLAGVGAPDPRTVVISLTFPLSTFPSRLANPGLGILQAASLPKAATAPVGSGPFRLDGKPDLRSGGQVTFRRVGERAHLDRVVVRTYATAAAAEQAYTEGEVDVAPLVRDEATPASTLTVPPAAPKVATSTTRAPRRPSGDVVSAPFRAVGYYELNLQNPKFADPRFRQAIIRALDERRIASSVYGGRVRALGGLIPAGVPGGPSRACDGLCDHDLAAAKKLVKAVFPDGKVPTVGIDFDESETQRALAKAAVAQLAEAGIPAVLRPHVPKDYADFLVNGMPEVFRFGWVADTLTERAFLAPGFVSTAPESVAHIGPAGDAAINQAAGTADAAKRRSLYAQAEKAILGQFAVKPLVQLRTQLITARKVDGIRLDGFGAFDAAAVRIGSS